MSHQFVAVPARRGILFLALAATAWGTTGAAVDLMYQGSDAGPLAVSFWRYLSGFVLLLALRAASRRDSRSHSPRLAPRLAIGFVLAVFQTAYFAAVAETGVAVATVVTMGAAPVFTAAGARLLLREKLSLGGVLSIAGAITGLVVLVAGDVHGTVDSTGVGLALLSGMAFAASNLIARWRGQAEDPYTMTAWSFGIGALIMLPFALVEGVIPTADDYPQLLTLLGYVALVPTALAYPLYFAGAAVVRAATSAVVMLIEPVAAAVIAVALLGEHVTVTTVTGTILLLGCVFKLARAESRHAPPVSAGPK